jgi:hypothetical protein
VLPNGVSWKKDDYEDADLAVGVWQMKKETDPSTVPPATLAKFAVGYLASPAAATELRATESGMGADEGAPDNGEEVDDSAN